MAPPQVLAADSPWWLGVTGLTNRYGFIEDGGIYACPRPGLLRAVDLAHVALAVETGVQDLALSQAPWSNPTERGSLYRVPGRRCNFGTFSLSLPTATLASVKLGPISHCSVPTIAHARFI